MGDLISLSGYREFTKMDYACSLINGFIGEPSETREFMFDLFSASDNGFDLRECNFLNVCAEWNLGMDATGIIYLRLTECVFTFYE